MTWLAKLAVAVRGAAASRRFDKAARDVRRSQVEKLRWILRQNAGTEYGRRFGFDAIDRPEEYSRRVPVIDYEDIAGEVRRMARGEQNVLTAERPVMFARTSGTTGEPKLIPVTRHCRGRDHADQMATWMYRAQRDHPGLLRGKVVSMVSAAVEGHTEAGIPYGSTSGVIYRDMPRLVRSTYAIPYEVFTLEDYFARYYLVLRLGVPEAVTFLCTANPSSVVKLCEFGDEHSEVLIRDVRDGTLHADLELPGGLRRRLTRRIRPQPGRARELEEGRRRRGGSLLPADYWPRLALIGCWKGGTVREHVSQFEKWFDPDGDGGVPVRDWGWLSSEARGSIPLADEGAGGVLTVATNYYEFVAADEVESAPRARDRWRFATADQLESGQDYYVFFTTNGGLYRYDINDVVRVVGHHRQAPVLEFVRKGRGMTSITGEKLSVEQMMSAVRAAAEEMHLEVAHYQAEADAGESHYRIKAEFAGDGPPDEERARRFLAEVDRQLGELNVEYQSKRESMRIGPPELWLMERGWNEERERQQGNRVFQSKAPLLVTAEDAAQNGAAERDERMCARRVRMATNGADAAQS